MGSSRITLSQKGLSKRTSHGLGELFTARFYYDFSVDGGAISTITPKKTVMLPKNAVIVAGTLNSITALTSGGSATVAVGTDAGSSATALLAATAYTSFSSNALINAVPVFATPVKLSAQGSITVTIATATVTAGAIEGVFQYYVARG